MIQDGSSSSSHHICIPGRRIEEWMKNKKGGKRSMPLPFKDMSPEWHSLLLSLCNLVTWLSLTAKKAEKCGLFQMIMCSGKNWGFCVYEKRENIHCGRTHCFCYGDFAIKGRNQLLNLIFLTLNSAFFLLHAMWCLFCVV